MVIQKYHIVCQENYVKTTAKHNASEAFSDYNNFTCRNYKDMIITRFFGPGVGNTLFTLFIFAHIFFTKKK